MRSFVLPSFIAAALLALAALGPPGFASLAEGASETIDVASIKPGMKGYGLTVFRGTEPERFDVEVIDVLHNFRPSQDLILIRTAHPVLEKALVVGGMSGSPVYLEGKLAGAYAYGWLFGKESVAGVTPIANMLTELARPVDPEIWRALGIPVAGAVEKKPNTQVARARGAAPSEHAAITGAALRGERLGAFGTLRQHAQAQGFSLPSDVDAQGASVAGMRDTQLTAAATPLMLAGFDERVVSLLDAELSRFGMPALQASGGAAGASTAAAQRAAASSRYVDGGAIGVQLIRGDLQATAIGTVTHVVGNKLVAFGHPMMNAGQPALPTATARVVHILASQQRSFKIAEALRPLGALVHDRQAAIVIDTALTPATVPMRVRVNGVPGAPRSEWNVQLAAHRALTPMLAFSAAANALQATIAEQTDTVFEVKSRVRIAGHGELELHDVGYSPLGASSPMAVGQMRVFDLIGVAYANPFEQARIENIDIELSVRYGRDLVTVIDAMVPAQLVDPGRDVNVYLTLRRFGQPDETRIVPVHVPATAAGEKIEIAFEPGNTVKLEHPKPDSLDQLFELVRAGYPATSLVVSTKLPTQGVSMRGHVVHDLPGSMLDTLRSTGGSDAPSVFATQRRSEIPMTAVVVGSARVKLEVRAEPLR